MSTDICLNITVSMFFTEYNKTHCVSVAMFTRNRNKEEGSGSAASQEFHHQKPQLQTIRSVLPAQLYLIYLPQIFPDLVIFTFVTEVMFLVV